MTMMPKSTVKREIDWDAVDRLAADSSTWSDLDSCEPSPVNADEIRFLRETMSSSGLSRTTEMLFEIAPADDDLAAAALSVIAPDKRSDEACIKAACSAFLSISKGRSTEQIIADPESNRDFLQACWRHKLQTGEFEANWLLMWCRKNGRLGPIPGVVPFSLPAEVFQACAWAAEAAMSMLQADFYFKRQSSVSLDKILCHPKLAAAFDEAASKLAPGFTPFQYRYAAVTIRKQPRKPSADTKSLPTLDHRGFCEQVRPQNLPTTAGVIVLHTGNRLILHTATSNIRGTFDAAMAARDSAWRRLPVWAAERSLLGPNFAGSLVEMGVYELGVQRTQSALAQSKALSLAKVSPFWNIYHADRLDEIKQIRA